MSPSSPEPRVCLWPEFGCAYLQEDGDAVRAVKRAGARDALLALRAVVEGLVGYEITIDSGPPIVFDADMGPKTFQVPPRTITLTTTHSKTGAVDRAAVLAAIKRQLGEELEWTSTP